MFFIALIFTPNAVAKPDTVKIDPHTLDVVATALKTPQQPTFPDLTANYNKMVADKALEAQKVVITPPAPIVAYTDPTQATDASVAIAYAQSIVAPDQFACLYPLWQKESGWNFHSNRFLV